MFFILRIGLRPAVGLADVDQTTRTSTTGVRDGAAANRSGHTVTSTHRRYLHFRIRSIVTPLKGSEILDPEEGHEVRIVLTHGKSTTLGQAIRHTATMSSPSNIQSTYWKPWKKGSGSETISLY